ncbi:MAG: helix-turn-helix domain-containing protein [Chloroflexota bacterium]
MKVLRAFKTELALNNVQKSACMRHAGATRFAYNWGLARKKEAFANFFRRVKEKRAGR